MEQGGFLDGVPLGSVKNARFIDKLGAFFTMTKLVLNDVVYQFTGVQNGSVIIPPDLSQCRFVAPDGKFNLNELSSLTASEMLENMALKLESEPLSAWEDFALWVSEDGVVEQVNQIFSACNRAEVNGFAIPLPEFYAPGNFPGFLRWIVSVIGAAGSLPASSFQNPDYQNRFDVVVTLYKKEIEIFGTVTFTFQV